MAVVKNGIIPANKVDLKMYVVEKTALYELLEFPVRGDHMGNLVALEKGEDFPFEIQRVYYVWGTDAHVTRGHHAHKELEQVIALW